MTGQPGRSEFHPPPKRSGVFGITKAFEKLRIIRRTEQDAEASPDLDAVPDKYLQGGVTIDNWKNIRG